MEPNNTKDNILLSATSLLAVLLPIVQISFIYLPSGLKSIFLQQSAFLGISLVTLVMSYVSIVAYKSRPWFTYVLPFHRQRMEDYNSWQQKKYEASAAMNFVSGEQATTAKIDKFLKGLEINKVKRPFQINSENRIALFIAILFINSVCFLILGLNNSTGWLRTLQSLNYFSLIVSSVLVLVIYRDTTNNNKRFNDNLKLSTTRAIDLAIRNNCFILQPQVKFISTHGGDGINNYFVRVEFDKNEYEICTNSDATKLIYCYKLQKS